MNINLVKNAQLSHEEIIQHLKELGEEFRANLEARVNIHEYGYKLSTNSIQNIVRVDQKLVGMIAYYVSDSASLYVSHVGVLKEWRKQHLASVLVKSLFKEACGNKIQLQVTFENTPARKLYEGLGFIATDTVGSIITMERYKNER